MRKNFIIILLTFFSLLTVLTACNKPAGSTASSALPQENNLDTSTASVSHQTTGTKNKDISSDNTVSRPETSVANSGTAKASSAMAEKAEALYQQGFQTYMNWKLDDAIHLFNQAIKADPGCYKAYSGKGIVLCFKGDYKNGMTLINKALDMKPDYVYANFNKALGYKIQKDFDNSMIWFNKALSLDPRDTWSYYGIACIYAERKDAENAVLYLKKAIDIDPAVKESARKEHDLDPVRSNPGFMELLK